mmetsp:Transcript_7700/g.14271  ORF Transcript_7700/g.14271 Transcript_7700/m.14271 type:complete len:85 (-) Transcript_7700:46-300(-)
MERIGNSSTRSVRAFQGYWKRDKGKIMTTVGTIFFSSSRLVAKTISHAMFDEDKGKARKLVFKPKRRRRQPLPRYPTVLYVPFE